MKEPKVVTGRVEGPDDSSLIVTVTEDTPGTMTILTKHVTELDRHVASTIGIENKGRSVGIYVNGVRTLTLSLP